MAKLNPGKYRHIVTIQKLIRVQDSYGEISPNDEANWENVQTVRAAIFPISGREAVLEEVRKGEISHRIYFRYIQGIDNTMRIKYGDRIFEIISPPVNSSELNHEIVLICKERNVKPTGA